MLISAIVRYPENIVIDELYLILRITDRLERGLILEVLDWDEVCDFLCKNNANYYLQIISKWQYSAYFCKCSYFVLD